MKPFGLFRRNRVYTRLRLGVGAFVLPSTFTPLVCAVLDAVSEGVVVFDAQGHLVYANESGRTAIQKLESQADAQDGELRDRLVRQGARVAPLKLGDSIMGEAACLPESDTAAGTLADRERQAILETLETTGWQLTRSARLLGISRTTLWRRLKMYGLTREAQREGC